VTSLYRVLLPAQKSKILKQMYMNFKREGEEARQKRRSAE
jgi:hypothetical protein